MLKLSSKTNINNSTLEFNEYSNFFNDERLFLISELAGNVSLREKKLLLKKLKEVKKIRKYVNYILGTKT